MCWSSSQAVPRVCCWFLYISILHTELSQSGSNPVNVFWWIFRTWCMLWYEINYWYSIMKSRLYWSSSFPLSPEILSIVSVYHHIQKHQASQWYNVFKRTLCNWHGLCCIGCGDQTLEMFILITSRHMFKMSSCSILALINIVSMHTVGRMIPIWPVDHVTMDFVWIGGVSWPEQDGMNI